MDKSVKPYRDSQETKKQQVARMFDTISKGYDTLNRVISMGSDVKWRLRVVKQVAEINPRSVLDIATGTGDLAIALSALKQVKITGLDLSEGMLSVGREKISQLQLSDRIELIQGDSEHLPFASETFDAVTVAFGVRNFENLEQGLSEILRVLRKGGRLVILETSVPQHFLLKQGYLLYTRYVLPLIGKLFSSDARAYSYLSESAHAFPSGKAFCRILEKSGFVQVRAYAQTLQVATIYVATKTEKE